MVTKPVDILIIFTFSFYHFRLQSAQYDIDWIWTIMFSIKNDLSLRSMSAYLLPFEFDLGPGKRLLSSPSPRGHAVNCECHLDSCWELALTFYLNRLLSTASGPVWWLSAFARGHLSQLPPIFAGL